MSVVLRGLTGWLVILGLLFIPWSVGGSALSARLVLFAILALAMLFWALGSLGRGWTPALPLPCLICGGWLVAQGWWMTLNAGHAYDPVLRRLTPIQPSFPQLAGSVDPSISAPESLSMTCAVMLLFLGAELARERKWLRRLWFTPAPVAVLVAMYGLFTFTAPALLPFNTGSLRDIASFGPFGYSGHAGSFLNFGLPTCIVSTWLVWRRNGPPLAKGVAVIGCLIVLAALVCNVSRTAHVIGVLTAVAVVVRCLSLPSTSEQAPGIRQRVIVRRFVVVGVVGILIFAAGLAMTWHKWSALPDQLNKNSPRLLMWRVGVHLLKNSGPMGTGPGTYRVLYPLAPRELLRELYPRWIVTHYNPDEAASAWSHAHNDYLEMAVEWGWVGLVAFLVILLGGMGRLWAQRRTDQSTERIAKRWAMMISLVGLSVQACLDPPFQSLAIQAYAAVYLGLAWGKWNVSVRPELAARPRVARVEAKIVASRVVDPRAPVRELEQLPFPHG